MKIEQERRYLITVDELGNSLGIEEKSACHQGEGTLHSAFLVMIFDRHSGLMQARRSRHKPLWPGFWDGTVAGHFVPGESPGLSLRRRVFEEVGVDCKKIDYRFKFSYQARYKNIGTEREVCHVYSVRSVREIEVALNNLEVSECRFTSVEEVAGRMESRFAKFTPWFLIAFRAFMSSPKTE
ncbi:MAG: NUDIX domain-containing protein [Acidobacteriota bacterium]